MERSDAAIRDQFKAWDRQIARLQDRCLTAPGPEGEHLRAILADLAAARERAWARWEVARGGGMWVNQEDMTRFEEAMRTAGETVARALGGGDGHEPRAGGGSPGAR